MSNYDIDIEASAFLCDTYRILCLAYALGGQCLYVDRMGVHGAGR
jgi:hypothetical protein